MYKKGRTTIYEKGDIVGKSGVVFIEEVPSKHKRRGVFICPICKQKFSSFISDISTGKRTECSLCKKTKKEIDKKYGSLTVIQYSHSTNQGMIYLCQCDCGNTRLVAARCLHDGSYKSCKECATISSKEKHKKRREEEKKNHILPTTSKDLTGKTFGLLTVLDFTNERNSNGDIIWRCQCECGNIILRSGHQLKTATNNNGIPYCGKCTLHPSTGLKDLLGQRFGRLVVINNRDIRDDPKIGYCTCRCDCGKITYVHKHSLQNGVIKSCGCLNEEMLKSGVQQKLGLEKRRQNYIEKIQGQKFGMLTPLVPYLNKEKSRYFLWDCICECGRHIEVRTSDLTQGRKISCGCITGSIGEQKIHKTLFDCDIVFEREKIFKDGKYSETNAFFRFDFYLPDYNCCIEYDGEQHYQESTMCSDSLEERQQKDAIKNQYCINNEIKLIRIPYWDYDKINAEYLKRLIAAD